MDSLLVQDHQWGQNGVAKWLFGCVVSGQNVEIQSRGGPWRELRHSQRTGTRERRQRWRVVAEQNKVEETCWSVFELYLASCSPLCSLSLSLSDSLCLNLYIYVLSMWLGVTVNVFLVIRWGQVHVSLKCCIQVIGRIKVYSLGLKFKPV